MSKVLHAAWDCTVPEMRNSFAHLFLQHDMTTEHHSAESWECIAGDCLVQFLAQRNHLKMTAKGHAQLNV